jgi:hypothetical protein
MFIEFGWLAWFALYVFSLFFIDLLLNLIILRWICLELNFVLFFCFFVFAWLAYLVCSLKFVHVIFFYFFLLPLIGLIYWNLSSIILFISLTSLFCWLPWIFFCLSWSISYHFLFFYYQINYTSICCSVESIPQVIFFLFFFVFLNMLVSYWCLFILIK